jgi:hypothetical protein
MAVFDDECLKILLKDLLILSVHSLILVERLVEEYEKRHASFISSLHLLNYYFLISISMCMNHLLTQFIEHLLSEGNQDVQEGPKLIDQVVSTTLPENKGTKLCSIHINILNVHSFI